MRKRLLAGFTVLIVGLAVDLQRPPSDQFTTRAALGSIHLYQVTLSPLYTWMGVRCRFTPNCSHYGQICVREFGVVRGGWLTVKRVLRCGPWTPLGTVDLPPKSSSHGFLYTGSFT